MFYKTLALAITTLREIKCTIYKVIINNVYYYYIHALLSLHIWCEIGSVTWELISYLGGGGKNHRGLQHHCAFPVHPSHSVQTSRERKGGTGAAENFRRTKFILMMSRILLPNIYTTTFSHFPCLPMSSGVSALFTHSQFPALLRIYWEHAYIPRGNCALPLFPRP